MTAEFLYTLLPGGPFNIQFVFDQIRDYSPRQRFPKPKYPLHDMLNAWYELTRKDKIVIINGTTATKSKM
jgi:hypothetical protein